MKNNVTLELYYLIIYFFNKKKMEGRILFEGTKCFKSINSNQKEKKMFCSNAIQEETYIFHLHVDRGRC